MYIQEATSWKNIRQNKEYKERKKQKKTTKQTKTNKELITKERTKEQRERITRGESPSPRPIKKRTTKRSKQLVIGFVHVLKSSPISLPPNTPH